MPSICLKLAAGVRFAPLFVGVPEAMDVCAVKPRETPAIQRVIIDKRPEQLKMDFHLWSRAAVGQLIEQEFGIKLQVRSIGKYLTRWGFTPQMPIKRAHEQSPAAVQAWLEGR